MTRLVAPVLALVFRSILCRPPSIFVAAPLSRPVILVRTFFSSSLGRDFFASSRKSRPAGPLGAFFVNSNRGLGGFFVSPKRRLAARRQALEEKPLGLDVKICIEEELPDDTKSWRPWRGHFSCLYGRIEKERVVYEDLDESCEKEL